MKPCGKVHTGAAEAVKAMLPTATAEVRPLAVSVYGDLAGIDGIEGVSISAGRLVVMG